MDKNERVAKLVTKWAEKIGERQAIGRLLMVGVSASTAEQLCQGRYKSIPRDGMATKLLEEMKKDGFLLAGKAS